MLCIFKTTNPDEELEESTSEPWRRCDLPLCFVKLGDNIAIGTPWYNAETAGAPTSVSI
ncbi:MAG: hypothetical protein LBG83_05565 [Oscillospiraceae bacterium]|jgi:hypothetical protein|nr:hypothetical protein [Oscillospiraceae bacterium]